MDNQRLNLGLVASVSVESFGEPGQRTFRIFAETSEGKVSIWIEKGQVVMLGNVVADLLEKVPADQGDDPTTGVLETFVGELEVRAGSLAASFDAAERAFTLEAGDFASPFDLSAVAMLSTRSQFAHLGEQIEKIVSASRPRCAVCGTPLTGSAHFCPESNGHARLNKAE